MQKDILCTIGPASMNRQVISRLDQLGASLFRINLSHTELKDVAATIQAIRDFTDVPICLDTEGAQIRTGNFVQKSFDVAEHSVIRAHKRRVPGDGRDIYFHPTDIIDTYGADTARWFMLSDSPPERDVIWTEDGVQGAWRFVQRVWRLIGEIAENTEPRGGRAPEVAGKALDLRRASHKTLEAVSADLENLGFNRAVARLYELVNTIGKQVNDGAGDAGAEYAIREAADFLVQMMAPMMPHLAEECWSALGHDSLISEASWPQADAGLLVEDEITYPIQINGKRRGELSIAKEASKEEVEAATLALDFVRNALAGNAPKKLIVVPQRIVNVVV